MAASGHKGKFFERLLRILGFRNKKKVEDKIEDPKVIYTNFLKVMAAIPGYVYSNNRVEKVTKNEANAQGKTNSTKAKSPYEFKRSVKWMSKPERRKLIDNISIEDIKNNQGKLPSKEVITSKVEQLVKKNKTDEKTKLDNRAKELEKSIINLIKKDLIKVVNEMEILQSELYILSEVNGESKVLKECQKELDKVKDMLCKIDKLKDQYDFLKDNYDFEYLLEIDNDDIVDKIIELRDTFGKGELKALAEDYKLLDVYRYLYLKIDDLQEKTAAFEEEKAKEAEKLKKRDIDFEKLKHDVYNVGYSNRNYESFVDNQNRLLKEIDEKVSAISSHEEVNYHLKGFGALFRNTLKYFGLLMVSPLKGLIPSIATETLITRNLIQNLSHNLEVEEERKMVYEAIDYSSLINRAISDLNSTSHIVDETLDDIVHLKMKYSEEFKKYQGDFVEYRDIMHKINDMENKILGNKIKIEMMKKKALEQQKVNTKKLVLVKEMNQGK